MNPPSSFKYSVRFLPEGEIFNQKQFFPDILFTQTEEYADWQKVLGKKILRVVVEDSTAQIVAFVQLFSFAINGLQKTYWYAPYGPMCVSGANIDAIITCLAKDVPEKLLYLDPKTVFCRLDFHPPLSQKFLLPKNCFSTPHTLLFGSIQPRSEWYLELNDTEENILAHMHSKTRYAINLALRKNVKVDIVSNINDLKTHLESFYGLLKETAERDGFSLHPKEYYETIFKNSKNIFLAEATCDGLLLASALVLCCGDIATFVFGGSANIHRNFSASTLVQWSAIRQAKQQGMKIYNFGGVSSVQFPVKSWQGLTSFKERFGGKCISHSHPIDLVVKPFWYWLYVARKWFKRYLHI